MATPLPKNDRRSLRTRKLLWQALMALLQEKPYAEITVQEIADRANINRVTFYFHYRDKQDLLETSVEAIFNELNSQITPFTGEAFRFDIPPEGLSMVYRYIADNAAFYRIILGENGIPFLVNRLRRYITEVGMQRFQLLNTPESQRRVPLEMALQYAAGSVMGLIGWWLENDMPISPEEFAHQTLLLTAYGVYWGAGIDPPKLVSD
jgi:AcrR family transcriptional regulator